MFRRKKTLEEIPVKPLEKPKHAPKGQTRPSSTRPASKVDLKNVSKPSSLQDIEAAIKAKKIMQIPSPTKKVTPSKPFHIKKAGTLWGLFPPAAPEPQATFKTQKEAITFAQTENLDYILYTADGKPKA